MKTPAYIIHFFEAFTLLSPAERIKVLAALLAALPEKEMDILIEVFDVLQQEKEKPEVGH